MKFNKGYTLLFAVLLSALIISISVSVMNIARKEVLLSSSARESMEAVYIADGALDCAILHDKDGYFRQTEDDEDFGQVTCGPRRVYTVESELVTPEQRRFEFYVTDKISTRSPCARVTIDRYDTTPPRTVIEARGYNVGTDRTNGRCTEPFADKVERAFRYSYTE